LFSKPSILVKVVLMFSEGMTSWKLVGTALLTIILASGAGDVDMPVDAEFRLAAINGNVTG
jgi:hypothetical protein